jgi:hypothetical protein
MNHTLRVEHVVQEFDGVQVEIRGSWAGGWHIHLIANGDQMAGSGHGDTLNEADCMAAAQFYQMIERTECSKVKSH